MDHIEKFLRKLRKKEYGAMLLIMMQLRNDFRKVPHVKALSGKKGWYRIRVGRYRIIFIVEEGKVEIRRITKRDDNTYRGLE